MALHTGILSFLAAGLLLLPNIAVAESNKRAGFSYLGIGTTQFNYEESTDSSGLSIRSKVDDAKPTQRSGVYVSVNSTWGFYFISSSYFGSDADKEDWDINGTRVQKNRFTAKRSEVQFLISRQLSANRHYLLFGASNIETSFTRFDFSYPQQDRFQIDEIDQNITEDASQLVGFFGYEFNQFYTSPKPGLRYQLQALVGIPLYTETLNNSAGDSIFETSFDGYSLRLNPSAGWQFNQHFLLSVSLGAHYSYRDEEKKSKSGEQLVLPEREELRMFPAVSMYWSF